MALRAYIIAFACLFSFFAVPASAAIKLRIGVEPYLGYSQFQFQTNDGRDQFWGTVLGGKGGIYVTDKAWVALDYHLGGPYFLANNDREYLNRMWGIGAGLRGLGRARIWAGYYYDAVLDDIQANAHLKGYAMKASLGVEFQTSLSLNVEYCYQNYSEVRAGGRSSLDSPEAGASPSIQSSVLFLSVSSPLFLY